MPVLGQITFGSNSALSGLIGLLVDIARKDLFSAGAGQCRFYEE